MRAPGCREWVLWACLGVASALLYGWFATRGSGQLFAVESLGGFYDAQARSWARGRWDVPETAIQNESFVRDGRHYGYFGPTPALLRAPLQALGLDADGRLSRVSVCLAGLAGLAATLVLLGEARRDLGDGQATPGERRLAWACFLACAGPGSTWLFLASRTYVYHEALAWGGALSLLTFALVLRCARGAAFPWLPLSAVTGLLAVHATALSAVAIVPLFALLAAGSAWPWLPARRWWCGLAPSRVVLATGIGAVALIMASYLAVNWMKFAQFSGMPYALYVQATPERLARTDGQLFRPGNVPFNTAVYLGGSTGLRFRASFPWVGFGSSRDLIARHPEARIDLRESAGSVPQTMPGLLVLGLLGWVALLRLPALASWRLVAASAAFPAVLLLAYFVVSHRYLHYFLPGLVVAGAVGVQWILRLPAQRWRRCLLALLVAGGLWSVAASAGIALLFQNEVVWGSDSDRLESYQVLRRQIDGFLGGPATGP